MDAKVRFGLDFLTVMLLAALHDEEGHENAYSLARLILITDWELTPDEQDEANKLLKEKIDNQTVDDLGVVAKRLLPHIKKDAAASERFMIGMMTINFLDGNVTDGEEDFTIRFANEFDFRRSEISAMSIIARNNAMAYAWFGETYIKAEK